MEYTKPTIILASGSPRRKEILQNAGIPFEILVTDADENVKANTPPDELVRIVSCRKAEAAVAALRKLGRNHAVIAAADTIVHIDGKILGKPSDAKEAFSFLNMLSGRTHDVYTGVTVAFLNEDNVKYVRDFRRTGVVFHPLTDNVINQYIATGEPFDKAGAYAIQGHGESLVREIDGSLDNVVGLPLDCLLNILRQHLDWWV